MASNMEDKASSKVAWLRSQLIGGGIEINTPFGRRQLVYADHTASGRCLQYVEKYIADKVLPYYGNTHTGDSHVGHTMTKMVHEASAYVKKCMGGGPTDALIFCGSGSTAAIKRLQEMLGIIVPSILRDRVLAMTTEEERWVVFVGPYEHHSNLLSWRNSLAEVVEIGMDGDGGVDVEALRVELGSEKYAKRPMLGSFSACSNVTGIYTDTRAMARLLHQHGAFACFDFAASGPYVDIDMRCGEIDGYDAVFVSPHKFVGGPGTPGILLMSEALYQLKSAPPSTCGGGTVAYVNGFHEKDTIYYENIEERENAGTPQIIQTIRAALTFWVKEYIGSSVIELHEHAYIDAAFQRLLPNQRLQILGNTQVTRQPMVSFLVFPKSKTTGKPLHGRFVAKLLNDLFGIQARGGCACAGPYGHQLLGIEEDISLALRYEIQKGYEGLKPGWTRVSFSYYMSKEEFAFILAAMEFVAEHGHRFLPLYQFNWENGNWTFRKRALKYNLMREELVLALSDMNIATGKPANTKDEHPIVYKDMKVNKFKSYLEAANRMVDTLPEHRASRRIPDQIDAALVLFEI